MIKINMRSSAHVIKSQGVGSCYEEQVSLIKNHAGSDFVITENKWGHSDIVHYHTVNPGYFIERRLTRKTTIGVGYVHFLPGTLDDSLKLPGLLRELFYKYLFGFYNSMDYLVTVNPYFIGEMRKNGVSNPEVVCIPNFVSAKAFYPMPENERNKRRERFHISKNKFVVLGVGQLQTRKGVLDFIETEKRLPDVDFIWAGGFSFGKMSKGYEEIKKQMRYKPENVRFMGIVDRKDMPDLYNAADVMFLPSYDELFPMAILEALCCKKPVLVRDIPLYDEILFDCCRKGMNTDGFAAIIKEMMLDAACYSHWCEKSWECHCLYSEETALEQWTHFYKNAFACFQLGVNHEEREGHRARKSFTCQKPL